MYRYLFQVLVIADLLSDKSIIYFIMSITDEEKNNNNEKEYIRFLYTFLSTKLVISEFIRVRGCRLLIMHKML